MLDPDGTFLTFSRPETRGIPFVNPASFATNAGGAFSYKKPAGGRNVLNEATSLFCS